MLSFAGQRIFLVVGVTDMRKSFNGLCGWIKHLPVRRLRPLRWVLRTRSRGVEPATWSRQGRLASCARPL